MSKLITVMIVLTVLLSACKSDITPEKMEYVKSIEADRIEYNDYMENNPNSPFNYKGKVGFHPLNYFDINPEFKFTSKLFEYETKDTITIYGTKGEERKTVRFGYLKFNFSGSEHKLNVYKSSNNDKVYYSIWFTDKTTNEETYGVGRYINFEKDDDPENIYTIDFNTAYNPYCAYSKEYSCAMPTKEDYLDLEVTAGEKSFMIN